MTVFLWCLSVMLTALIFAVARARGPKTAILTVEAATAPKPVALQALRPSPRVAVQTSAALLAIALALDVSSPAQAFEAPAEDGVYVAHAQDLYVLPDADAQAWTQVETRARLGVQSHQHDGRLVDLSPTSRNRETSFEHSAPLEIGWAPKEKGGPPDERT